MVQPISWPQIKTLLDANVARRFRIKESDRAKRDGIIRQFNHKATGRWGFCHTDDSLLLGVEDPEDIQMVKVMFYQSWRKLRQQ